MSYKGLAGTLNQAAKKQPKKIKPLGIIHTQSEQMIINNSRYPKGDLSKVQYDDLPKYKIQSFKKGGKVNKTGIYKLHKGEVVIPRNKVTKSMKKKMGFKK